MHDVSFDVAWEARFALGCSCTPFTAQRRMVAQLITMRAEIHRQTKPELSDESWCTSNATFHRASVGSAHNVIIS